MKTAIISVTRRGALLGQQIRAAYEGMDITCYEKEGKESGQMATSFSSMKPLMGEWFATYDRILCIMATGIVVRMIAPYIKHKSEDPAIIVMDEGANFAISLLSGHLGGANEWTHEVATITGATPVVTTATDVNQLPAPDVLARKLHLTVEDFKELIAINAAIVDGQAVPYYVDSSLPQWEEYLQAVEDHGAVGHAVKPKDMIALEEAPKVLITDRVVIVPGHTLILRPKTMTVGIGCRRDTKEALILEAVTQSLAQLGRSPKSVLSGASVIVKADEVGLLAAMKTLQWPISFFTQEEMAPLIEEEQIQESKFVKNTIGVGNVCETTALLMAQSQQLLQQKTIYPRTTVAVAQVHLKLSALDQVIRSL